MIPVRTLEEARAKLNETPEGRELMQYCVALADIEAVVNDVRGVSAEIRERVVRGLRARAEGCDVIPHYLFMFVIGECINENDTIGIRRIVIALRHAGDRLPVASHPGQTLH